MNPVSLVTIHHEGAGTPTDVARGADGGYSIWIGVQRYTVLRSPWISFATKRFNHVSLDICLSGNRTAYPVGDVSVALIRNAVAEARANGWVTDTPQVRAHKNSPGSSTECPGDNTMSRWSAVVAACQKPTTKPTPTISEDEPMLFPTPTPKVLNRFSGAQVDLKAKKITLLGGAKCAPTPVVVNPNPWKGAYEIQRGTFVVVTENDLDEYKFVLS